MNKMQWTTTILAAAALGLLGGCGGTTNGVHAVVPGPEGRMRGNVAGGGQYTLYRAVLNEVSTTPRIESVWTVSASGGEQLGFRYSTVQGQGWNPDALHLIAYAGGQTRDLGPYKNRRVEYLWAGSEGDVASYYSAVGADKASRTLFMQ